MKNTNNNLMQDFGSFCEWEQKKALYILQVATGLGMDISGYGFMGVNQNSGYTYLWLEDYSFTLYMPINCDLKKSEVWASWSNPENGEEIETVVGGKSLFSLEKWADRLNKSVRA